RLRPRPRCTGAHRRAHRGRRADHGGGPPRALRRRPSRPRGPRGRRGAEGLGGGPAGLRVDVIRWPVDNLLNFTPHLVVLSLLPLAYGLVARRGAAVVLSAVVIVAG